MSKIKKTDQEWKGSLSDESFKVTRESATERPFTGKYWDFDESGIYKCICCSEPLLSRKQNLMLVADGQASLYLLRAHQLPNMKIIHYLEQELK